MIVGCTLLRHHMDQEPETYSTLDAMTLLVVAGSAAVVFPLMVRACHTYMDQVPPTLPSPRNEPRTESSVTAGT